MTLPRREDTESNRAYWRMIDDADRLVRGICRRVNMEAEKTKPWTWDDYVLWTHETAVRRSSGATDDREKAELMEIWGLGLGGEFCELLVEIETSAIGTRDERAHAAEQIVPECGDLAYYVARLYADTGNVRGPALDPSKGTVRDMAKHVGKVIETMKKALRKEGRPGLNRLAGDRRLEFAGLLDNAICSVDTWLARSGLTLEAVCEANKAKLLKRRAEGTIAAQGQRS